MGRSGRGRAGPAPARASAPASTSRPQQQQAAPSNPPQQYHAPPPAVPQQGGGGMFSGLGGAVVQGMAVGTGSALAHQAVRSIFGSGGGGHEAPAQQAAAQQAPVQANPSDPCFKQSKAFMDCLENNNYDQGACEYYLQAMQQCKVPKQQWA